MSRSRPRALITGGCGFVGRRFAKWLLDHEYDVTLVDDLSSGLKVEFWPALVRPHDLSHLHVHYADFRNFANDAQPDYELIIHLAAVVGGRPTIDGDPLRVATDLAIDATFFNWLARSSARPKVLYFSSSAAYPVSEQTESHHRPLVETLIDFRKPLGVPDMTYGWAKLSGEYLALHAVAEYGMDVVVYRPFSGYGEDQDFSYPFPSIVRRVGRRESPIVVWGSGRQLRDFIHIDDVVNAVFATAWAQQPGAALNLGSGVGHTFSELAHIACQLTSYDAEIVNDPSKPEGVFARVGDCTRMFKYFRPRISLEEGMRRVYCHQLDVGHIPHLPAAVA